MANNFQAETRSLRMAAAAGSPPTAPPSPRRRPLRRRRVQLPPPLLLPWTIRRLRWSASKTTGRLKEGKASIMQPLLPNQRLSGSSNDGKTMVHQRLRPRLCLVPKISSSQRWYHRSPPSRRFIQILFHKKRWKPGFERRTPGIVGFKNKKIN